jgi:hypothetical protein
MLIQTKSGTATSGTTVTVTLDDNPTLGNCLIVSAGNGGSTLRAVSGITIGGVADNFALAKAGSDSSPDKIDVETWTDQDIGQTSKTIVVTFNGAITDAVVFVEEWSGVSSSGAVDKTNSGNGATTAFSSGATGTLTQSAEIVHGAVMCTTLSAAPTITGPGSPWTNLAQVSAGDYAMMVGYQVVSATTTQTYSGTQTGISFEENTAVIVSLKQQTAITASGGITLNPIGLSGTVEEIFTASGGLKLNPVSDSGSITETFEASGGLKLNPISNTGTATPTADVTVSGGITLNPIGLSGTTSETGSDITASGGITLAPISLAGAQRHPGFSSGFTPFARVPGFQPGHFTPFKEN